MYEEVCYQKPFLKEVVARIDFVAPLAGLEKNLPTKLANTASDHFPIAEPTESTTQELTLEASGKLQHRETRFQIWNFFGKDREKQLTLAAPFMFISFKKYTTFENMKEAWAAIVQAVGKAFPDGKAARFGLRYINSIEIDGLPPTTWNDYIANGLLGSIAFFNQPESMTRLNQVAEFKYDDVQVRGQFGMPNPDYPAVMKRAMFVVDLDAYVDTAHDLSDSLQHMDKAHEHIQALFEKCITAKLRERMNANAAA